MSHAFIHNAQEEIASEEKSESRIEAGKRHMPFSNKWDAGYILLSAELGTRIFCHVETNDK